MKRLFLELVCLVCLTSISLQANWFDSAWNDVKSGFESTGNAIYKEVLKPTGQGIVTGAEQTYEKVLKPAAGGIVSVTGRLEACAEVVGLGTGWAAAQAGLGVATGTLEAARKSAEGIAFVTEQLGRLAGQVINLEEAWFEVNASDIAHGKLITMNAKGVFFGQRLDITVPFDVVDMAKNVDRFFKEIMKKLGF
jgi:hypothetical protein